MDLRASKGNGKPPSFDAFKGNPLIKSSSTKSRTQQFENKDSIFQSNRRLASNYNFDELWRGSVTNLMSSENLTEDLIKESIKELENAMQESKRMLTERDTEINKLREFIENNKNGGEEAKENLVVIKEQLEKSQRQIVELECELSETKVKHSREIADLKKQLDKQPQVNCEQFPSNSNGLAECTCYCGGNCKSARELYETRKIIETVKQKYEQLKRRVRDFRKQAEESQQKAYQEYELEKSSSCTIQ